MKRMRVAATLTAVATIGLLAAPGASAAELVPNGVVSWGADGSRQLGDGDPNQNQPVAVDVDLSAADAGRVVEVCGGFEHSLARTSDGSLFGWGSDFFGQLGQGADGGITEYGSPVPIPLSDPLVDIDCGNKHSIALNDDARVVTWGQNSTGQLGDGTTQDRPSPTVITLPAGSGNVVAVSGGEEFSLALLADGRVASWGRDDRGQLGQGIVWDPSIPAEARAVTVPAVIPASAFGGERVTAISAGLGHSLAVTETGAVWSWGRNNDGQLGDGSTTDRISPVRVDTAAIPSDQRVTGVTAGSFHSVALTAAGTLYSWGGNFVGALGDGTSERRLTPVPVSTGDGSALQDQTVVQVAAGTDFTLALTAAGVAVSWGGNGEGRLGAPSPAENKTQLPTEVQRTGSAIGGQRVSTIGAGYLHAVAVTAVLVIAPLTVDDPGNAPVARTFEFSGSGEPTATITVLDADGAELGSGVVGTDGRWSITPGDLDYGTATYTVRQSYPGAPDEEVQVELTVAPAPLVVSASADTGGILTVTGSGEPGAIVRVTGANGEPLTLDDGIGGTTESFAVGSDGVIRLVLARALATGQRTIGVSQTIAGLPDEEVSLAVVVPAAPATPPAPPVDGPPAVDAPPAAGPPVVDAPGAIGQPDSAAARDDARAALGRTGAESPTLPLAIGALLLGFGGILVGAGRRGVSLGRGRD